MEIEKAKFKLSILRHTLNCENFTEYKMLFDDKKISDSLDKAIQALEEKAEREKGCEYCKERKPILDELEDCEDFIQNKFGYCFYSLEARPLIYNLYVHPQYRKCGHSRMLLKCIINEIRKTGYGGLIYIQVNPRENSIESDNLKKYYESMGFSILNSAEESW